MCRIDYQRYSDLAKEWFRIIPKVNVSLNLIVFKSSFLMFIILSSMSLTVLASIMPAFGDVYDDFTGGYYSLPNEEISPDGKWKNVYNGGGSSGVGISGDKHVFFLYPKASTSSDETNANLVISTRKFSNFNMEVNVRTADQLRANDPPKSWETAWILFRYTDTFHYYWLELNPGGAELGKKDCGNCTDSVQGQIFLATVDNSSLKVGDWSHWKITAVGNHIRWTINGTRVIDYVDDNMSPKLAKGSIGLYTEDAYAEFNNLNITEVNFHHFT